MLGARFEEPANPRLDQLQREGDVCFFDIQKVKNANSQRHLTASRLRRVGFSCLRRSVARERRDAAPPS